MGRELPIRVTFPTILRLSYPSTRHMPLFMQGIMTPGAEIGGSRGMRRELIGCRGPRWTLNPHLRHPWLEFRSRGGEE